MTYRINSDDVRIIITEGIAQSSSASLPKAHWASDPETANFYPFRSRHRAKKLLAEAGYPNGVDDRDLRLVGPGGDAAAGTDHLAAAKAGIRVKLTPLAPQQAVQAYMIDKKGAMFITPSVGVP